MYYFTAISIVVGVAMGLVYAALFTYYLKDIYKSIGNSIGHMPKTLSLRTPFLFLTRYALLIIALLFIFMYLKLSMIIFLASFLTTFLCYTYIKTKTMPKP